MPANDRKIVGQVRSDLPSRRQLIPARIPDAAKENRKAIPVKSVGFHGGFPGGEGGIWLTEDSSVEGDV